MNKSQQLLIDRDLQDVVISKKGEPLTFVSDLLEELLYNDKPKPKSNQSVESKVLFIICNQLSISANDFSLASYWHQDLDADSLDDIEFIMSLEEEFNIEIDNEESEQYADFQVSTIIDMVKSKLDE